MVATLPPTDHRRSTGPQAPLPREVPREALIAALRGRFHRPVTVMVAGAGFGKTTALAQAVRTNLAAPAGVDIWVSCEAGDEDDRRLAAALLAGLASVGLGPAEPEASVQITDGGSQELVLDAIARVAPLDVCLMVDDLHRLPAGSRGLDLLGGLVDRLPANGHLVLVSRHQPALPLARARASAEVLDLGERELGFTADEATALASLHGCQPATRFDLGGWPALVALSLSTGRPVSVDVTADFLREEIVTAIDRPARRALLAMITLGDGSFADVEAVAGGEAGPDEVRRVLRSVPLVSGDPAEQTFDVHDLWAERLDQIFDLEEIVSARARSRSMLIDRGEILRLGSLAVRWGDDRSLLVAAKALVGASLINLPVATGRRWLAAASPGARDEPELRLLALAVDVATRPTDPAIDAMADDVMGTFECRGDVEGAVDAATLAMIVAHRRGDPVRAYVVTERVRALPGGEDSPTVRLALAGADAALAYLDGGAGPALEALEPQSLDEVPGAFADFVKVLTANWLLEAGRAGDAVRAVDSVETPDASMAEFASYIYWHGGDPGAFVDRAPELELGDLASLDARRRFIRCTELAEIGASLGRSDLTRAARDELATHVGAAGGVLYSGAAAGAMAKTHVLDGNESGARAALDAHLDAFPIDDPIGDAQLRRRFATGYLVHDELARRWDAIDLGPHHRRVRDLARLVIQARTGRLGGVSIDDPGLVITSLPLPWSVELAVAARRDAAPGATALIDLLTAAALGPMRSALRTLAADGSPALAAPAADLLSELPHEDGPVLRIEVLGPLRVALDGQDLDRSELRRSRVRTLLALLVVRGPLRRDELLELMWPDRDPKSARQNLRTTLTYLRRLLEPEEGGVDGPRRLRTDGDRLSLAGPAGLEVDLWQFRDLVDRAGRGTVASPDGGSVGLLHRAVELWRGDPVPDVESVIGLEADIEQIRAELVDATHRLGELLLAVGRFTEALECADRTRTAAPYSERAHRLAVSALVQLNDRRRLRSRVEALRTMLAELGVEPEPSTAMLLTRAADLLGTLDHH